MKLPLVTLPDRELASPLLQDRMLTYGRQCLDDADKRAVLDVLEGDWLTQGPMVDRFEQGLCEYFGTKYAVACSSGTAALHLTALALNWGEGDAVIVPAITFLATANCCAYVGAEPYCVDIDDASLTIDPNEVERHVKLLRASGRRVRAVIGVDMAGHPCDWRALRELADRYDLTLVDDACHAMGGSYADGVKVGSCTDSDVTTLSFHPVKHITTGEGGAILTNDGRIAGHARRLRCHGTVRGEDQVPNWEGPWHSDMVELGYNYRLTDLQCALGLSQLRKLDAFVERRRQLADRYTARFSVSNLVRCPTERPLDRHAYHLYIARMSFDRGGRPSRRELFARCQEQGIQLQVHYRPLVQNTYYRRRGFARDAAERLPVSHAFYQEAASLPIYPQLEEADVERVVEVVETSLGGFADRGQAGALAGGHT